MNKTRIQLIAMATGVSLLLSCGSPATTKTKEPKAPETKSVLDKLVGTWKSEDGKSYERWNKNTDGSYHSTVYMLKGKDTAFMEQAEIFPENGKWIFENIVTGQNDGQKTRFTADNVNEKNIRFANPEHDFPNEINYTLPDHNRVNAFITGKNERGGMDTIPFNYTRVE